MANEYDDGIGSRPTPVSHPAALVVARVSRGARAYARTPRRVGDRPHPAHPSSRRRSNEASAPASAVSVPPTRTSRVTFSLRQRAMPTRRSPRPPPA